MRRFPFIVVQQAVNCMIHYGVGGLTCEGKTKRDLGRKK